MDGWNMPCVDGEAIVDRSVSDGNGSKDLLRSIRAGRNGPDGARVRRGRRDGAARQQRCPVRPRESTFFNGARGGRSPLTCGGMFGVP